MGKGGVPVFNQKICEALATEHSVTLLTAALDTPPHHGVQVVNAPFPPDSGDQPPEGRVWLEYCAQFDPQRLGLPAAQERPFDLLIGHSRFSGPAVIELRDRWYPDARVTHILHTSPERLPEVKYPHDLERAQGKAHHDSMIEREVMAQSDLVVGVGPLLTQESQRLSSTSDAPPRAHELMPGTTIEEPIQHSTPNNRLNLLITGRTDDPLKGVNDAASAVKQLNDAGIQVHVTVRGAQPEGLIEAQQTLQDMAGSGNVTVKPFTDNASELQQDVRSADAVLMPSHHEGFGLVATEALGHGTPVLVNQDSGAAQFLGDEKRIDPRIGQPCIVPEPQNTTQRPNVWANAIAKLHTELPERRAQAQLLREELKKYSWPDAGRSLVQASMNAPTLAARTATNTHTHTQQQTTVQGPHGTLMHNNQSSHTASESSGLAAAQSQPNIPTQTPNQPQTQAAPSKTSAPVSLQDIASMRTNPPRTATPKHNQQTQPPQTPTPKPPHRQTPSHPQNPNGPKR
nr:glycosyltransferase family 4 protein [Streptomyces oceani]